MPTPDQETTRRPTWITPLAAAMVAAILAAAVWVFLLLRDGGDETGSNGASGDPAVIVIDESEVSVVQNPSLRATVGADGVTVENDGNLTMHDITVTEGDEELCMFDEMAPGDSEVCAGATATASISGLGPQDQPVDIGVG